MACIIFSWHHVFRHLVLPNHAFIGSQSANCFANREESIGIAFGFWSNAGTILKEKAAVLTRIKWNQLEAFIMVHAWVYYVCFSLQKFLSLKPQRSSLISGSQPWQDTSIQWAEDAPARVLSAFIFLGTVIVKSRHGDSPLQALDSFHPSFCALSFSPLHGRPAVFILVLLGAAERP